MRRQASPALRPQSKPSKHYGTEFWFIDGPLGATRGQYRGKRARVTIGFLGRTQVAGEYRHEVRNVGAGLGYEHYYQWYGPTPEMLQERGAA